MCGNACFEKTLHYTSPGHGGWGIIRVAALIPESYLLFICPSACFRHGALGAIQHGYKNRISYLYITPADIVEGYDRIIEEGTAELLEGTKEKIKVLFLFVSCLDDFIGTDLDMVARQLEKKYEGITIRACHMNPIAMETSMPPLVTVYRSMLSAIPKEEAQKEKENAINLLGTFEPIPKKCEIHDFMRFHGIEEVKQIADCKDFEEYSQMGRSRYNLVMTPAAACAADYVDKTYVTSSVRGYVSYDVEEIERTYQEIEVFLKTEKRYDFTKEKEETDRAIKRAVQKAAGIPVIVSDSAVLRPFSLALALYRYGFNVTEVIAQNVSSVEKGSFEKLLELHKTIKINQPQHHKVAVRDNPDTRAVAIGFEGAYLRQSDHVVDLSEDEGMFGYDGVQRLMHMIEKAVDKKADLRKMIEEYGAVV